MSIFSANFLKFLLIFIHSWTDIVWLDWAAEVGPDSVKDVGNDLNLYAIIELSSLECFISKQLWKKTIWLEPVYLTEIKKPWPCLPLALVFHRGIMFAWGCPDYLKRTAPGPRGNETALAPWWQNHDFSNIVCGNALEPLSHSRPNMAVKKQLWSVTHAFHAFTATKKKDIQFQKSFC